MINAITLFTIGFRKEVPEGIKEEIIMKTLKKINPKTDFIVFDPNAEKEKYEDERRTLRIPMPGLKKKVYAKLDDYGSPELLSRDVGFPVDTQYVVTFMLAEEY